MIALAIRRGFFGNLFHKATHTLLCSLTASILVFISVFSLGEVVIFYLSRGIGSGVRIRFFEALKISKTIVVCR